jgi:membrane protease YdiL (CAAX protease family)
VFAGLRRVSGRGVSIAVSSLAFTAHHVIVIQQFVREWPTTLALSLWVAIGGGLWALLYERHKTLYAPWMSHLLVDCGIMLLGYDLVAWK